MNLYLRTSSDSDDFNGDCDIAAVEMDKALADLILKRVDMFNRMHQEDDRLAKIKFYDGHARYFKVSFLDENEVEDALVNDVESDPTFSDYEFPADQEQRTEYDRMVICSDWVFWQCEPKHSGVLIETDLFPIAQVREIAERAE